jgi:hypothetical protein
MLRRLFGTRTARPATPPTPCRLGVEALESREVPTVAFGLVGNRILVFDVANPRVILNALTITGYANSSERVIDIDVRPASGGLYGFTNQGRLYLINPLSGFALLQGSGSVSVNTVYQGYDFNPSTDRIRVTSNLGQNLQINPNFGTLESTDTPLAYKAGDPNQGVPPRVTGLAYSNNFVFPPSTTLYGIDHNLNRLVTVGNPSPSDGQLTTIGGLGLNVVARVGFDILTIPNTPNVAYAVLQRAGQNFSGFYRINLSTGAAGLLGTVGNRRLVNDLAIDIKGTAGFGPPTSGLSLMASNGNNDNGDSGDGGRRMAASPRALSVFPAESIGSTNWAPTGIISSGDDTTPEWFDHAPIHVG